MKEKRKIVISYDSMDKYFVLVCEKLENLERLTKGLEPRRRFIHTQVLHTKTQFLKFMQIVCGNLNNLHHIIEIQKEKLGEKSREPQQINELISQILDNDQPEL